MQLALLAGSSIGVSLGVFGSGGSVLALPVLVYLAGQSPKEAVTGSLFIVTIISITTLLFSDSRRQIHWPNAVALGVPGIAGTYSGALLASLVSGAVQLAVFAILMLVSSSLMWRQQPKAAENNPAGLWLMVATGFLVGIFTGFAGVGGGFLLLPALVMIARLDFLRARATSLLLIAVNASVGFIKNSWLLNQQGSTLDWLVLISIATLGALGALIGQHYSARWPQQRLRKGFAVFLILLAGLVFWQTLPELMEVS
ncbi:hypothetical protein HMF8227_02001 [Saliniradius amylolyticus]|uniref:Probable membrane transporter protein n=1 Tax=Saliniradius amylolyticus TaxID=2183582 RepID=A0A2S2E494_9ALTE|nr:sulfite exporter TauE/SafE family protein [Saliniradius amylolyticus]AWL12471.1 hypothetical protein HMF8227_02001 [Saliniradius amylolyticus]